MLLIVIFYDTILFKKRNHPMHTIHFMLQEKEGVAKTLIISFIMQYLFKEVAQNPSFSL